MNAAIPALPLLQQTLCTRFFFFFFCNTGDDKSVLTHSCCCCSSFIQQRNNYKSDKTAFLQTARSTGTGVKCFDKCTNNRMETFCFFLRLILISSCYDFSVWYFLFYFEVRPSSGGAAFGGPCESMKDREKLEPSATK